MNKVGGETTSQGILLWKIERTDDEKHNAGGQKKLLGGRQEKGEHCFGSGGPAGLNL